MMPIRLRFLGVTIYAMLVFAAQALGQKPEPSHGSPGAGDTPEIVGPLATDLSPALDREAIGKAMRKVGDWQSFSYPPDTPQLVAPTYIITFESTYQAAGAIPTYETVTVVKENRNWRVMEFTWNSQTSDTSAR